MIRKIKKRLKQIMAPLFARGYQGCGHILVLHRVVPKSNKLRIRNDGIEICEEQLERLILFFKKRDYDFISIEELQSHLLGKADKKFVIFTFDDGYIDNLTHAYPILKRHEVPFTIYLTTDFPDQKAILWWYLLEELILSNQFISFEYGGEAFEFDLQDRIKQEECFNDLRNLFKSKEPIEQKQLAEDLFLKYDIPLYQKVKDLSLSWEQIQSLVKDPLVTIGAHTINHPSFKSISEGQIVKEVIESIKRIEDKINKKVDHFAYPFGSAADVGEKEVKIVSILAVKTATTGLEGNIFKEHLHQMHALPRIYIGPKTTERELENKINGTTFFIKGAKQRVMTV
jgi:peptidoglycan/xylan/chitin deacetylase (PgdA/CDA1 family)